MEDFSQASPDGGPSLADVMISHGVPDPSRQAAFVDLGRAIKTLQEAIQRVRWCKDNDRDNEIALMTSIASVKLEKVIHLTRRLYSFWDEGEDVPGIIHEAAFTAQNALWEFNYHCVPTQVRN